MPASNATQAAPIGAAFAALYCALSDLLDQATARYPTDPDSRLDHEVRCMEVNAAAHEALDGARAHLADPSATAAARTGFWANVNAVKAARESAYPVKVELVAELAATAAKLGDGIARAVDWQGVTPHRWPIIATAMHGLVDRLCSAGANLNRMLPTHTDCVCDGDVWLNGVGTPCKVINLPNAMGAYKCRACGHAWQWQRGGDLPLRFGFWKTHRPGDRYVGSIGVRLEDA